MFKFIEGCNDLLTLTHNYKKYCTYMNHMNQINRPANLLRLLSDLQMLIGGPKESKAKQSKALTKNFVASAQVGRTEGHSIHLNNNYCQLTEQIYIGFNQPQQCVSNIDVQSACTRYMYLHIHISSLSDV